MRSTLSRAVAIACGVSNTHETSPGTRTYLLAGAHLMLSLLASEPRWS
jgi:hypothetical protein